MTKEIYKQNLSPALSVHDNVNHRQDNMHDQHVNTSTPIGSQLVIMVLRAQWPLGAIVKFSHFVAEEKKKRQQKQRRFMTGLPQVSQ